MKAVSPQVFKKKFRISQAKLNGLIRERKVTVQQNGYKGDSLAHHKLIVFDEAFKVYVPKKETLKPEFKEPALQWAWCFKCRKRRRARKVEGRRKCGKCGSTEIKKAMPFVSTKALKRQNRETDRDFINRLKARRKFDGDL